MTLIGSIIDHYTSGTENEAIALRTALGTGKLFRDKAPEGTAMPYALVSEISTTQIDASKGQAFRIESARLQFDVFTVGTASADAILEAFDNAFSGPEQKILTVTNRIHLGTYFVNRMTMEDPEQRVFHGILECDFRLQK